MTIDPSAVARVVGITTEYKDLRSGGILYLPQRGVVIAQGESGVTYSTDKFQAQSAAHVGSILGYKGPAYQILRQLLPVNGDGVGTIPITVYPLNDHASGVAATGDITPAGTQSKAAAYRIRVAGVESQEFVQPAGAVNVNRTCAEIGKAMSAILHMPVFVTYEYGSVTATPDGGNTGDGTLTALSVNGTPVPGDYTLECIESVIDAGFFRLTDPDGTIVSKTVDVTGATQTVGGIAFTLADGATDFAVGDKFTITVPATKVNLTAAWKGASSNGMLVEILGDTSLGTTFAITQPTGGLVNPTVDAALAQMGNVWETMVLNALDAEDTTALDATQTFGEGRWQPTVRRPLVTFYGNTTVDVADATFIPSGRKDDRVNSQLVAPGSPDLPFVVAARQFARIIKLANENPPHDYGSQRATGLTPGRDSEQWDAVQRELAVKAGSSTIQVKDGVINVSDVITHYAPSGEPIPGYRYVVDIVRLQQVLFNLDLIFASSEWDGAPLIGPDDVSDNPTAKTEDMAIQAVNNMIDALGRAAILADTAASKKATTASISTQNGKRLQVGVQIKLSGNTNIIDLSLVYGFNYGSAAA